MDRELIALLDGVSASLDAEGRRVLADLVTTAGGDKAVLLDLLKDLATYDYRWKPAPMREFIHGSDFLGLKEGEVWPRLVDDLEELFEGDYEEAVLFGSIGWGKSTFATLAMSRLVYELSCFRDPQKTFGLKPGSTIALINASVNLKQSEKVVFQGVKDLLERSPYFQKTFEPQSDLKKELTFPSNVLIMPVAASEGGTIGYNVYGGVLDEVNFWRVVERSTRAQGQKYDQARTVYDMLKRRIKSRFNYRGRTPGLLIQVSSSQYPDDFTEQRATEVVEANRLAAEHPNEAEQYPPARTFVRRYATWDTQPADRFMPSKFYVYRGTSAERPALAREQTTFADKDQSLVIEVPMDYWSDFEKDIDGSIRDVGGYPTLTITPFFTQVEKLMESVERGKRAGLVHPYSVDIATLEDGQYLDARRIKFDPAKLYFAHIDLALGKKDAAGVAVVHIDDWRTVTRLVTDPETNESVVVADVAPVVVADLMLKIVAPKGQNISLAAVRSLLLEMRSRGANFKVITYDQYQSEDSIQAFQRLGIESGNLSVDVKMNAYNALVETIVEDRFTMYYYPPFQDELVRLETRRTGRGLKVEHPPAGSKDVADAVAGAVFHATQTKLRPMIAPSQGIVTNPAGAGVPEAWSAPMEGLAPTTDARTGAFLPGFTRKRTAADIINHQLDRAADTPTEDTYGYGFA